tara:strand:+ start:755 stop:1738 length:984 start_codon:yes stop_codon:yes gene_type:complete
MMGNELQLVQLNHAIEAALSGVSLRKLGDAAERLSVSYRSEQPPFYRSEDKWSEIDRLAYIAARMPSTYSAAVSVLDELHDRVPELEVRSLLDIGAGPATCLWAAGKFVRLRQAKLVEPDREMAALGEQLLTASPRMSSIDRDWQITGCNDISADSKYDLVISGYVLSELDDLQRKKLINTAWETSRHAVILVESGSMKGFRHILESRDQLISLGARIVAPCPHEGSCLMASDDWCHFGVRLNRSSIQRRVKGAALSYEDEKYSYVVATHGIGSGAAGRVIRRPVISKGRVKLDLCTGEGIIQKSLIKGDGDSYRRAKKLNWADSVD